MRRIGCTLILLAALTSLLFAADPPERESDDPAVYDQLSEEDLELLRMLELLKLMELLDDMDTLARLEDES